MVVLLHKKVRNAWLSFTPSYKRIWEDSQFLKNNRRSQSEEKE